MRVIAIKNPKSEVERRLIHEMHRLRARIFRGRLAWTVRCTSGLELDGFDKLSPTYVLCIDRSDSVIGCARLLPAAGGTMLEKVFPQLLEMDHLATHHRMIESSRFCVDTNAPAEREQAGLHSATLAMFAGIIEWSILNGYREIVTATDVRLERKGTNISRKWRGTPGLVTTGPDGKVIFLFGETQPSVVCSPLQVCDIELQGGEIVRDVLVGDTVRWKVEPATSGATGGQAIHLIVKPSEAGLVTSMVVTTSRRTYHIQLKSHPSQYMARIGFEYPEDVSTKLADINARLETGGIPGTAPDKLNFSYSVSGSASWRPKRVYSDGAKTYIQFPRSISGQDAPVLFVVSGGQNRIVNYRMKNDVMIVDYAVDKAVLVSGVGWRKQKITIRRGG